MGLVVQNHPITSFGPMRLLALLLSAFLVHATHAQTFSELVDAIENADPTEHEELIADFVASSSFPHIENDTTVVFLYRGDASSVMVTGDFSGWSPNGWALERLMQTELWYRMAHFEPDARIDYKIILNETEWMLDPANPNWAPSGFGPNSELAMTEYEQPWEVRTNESVPKGTLESHSFSSAIMANTREVSIFLPSGYDANRADPYPIILYHDGSDYLNAAGITTILDNLIGAGRVEPLVAVFANPLDREAEYATTETAEFTRLIVGELMPWVEEMVHVSSDPARRAVTGPSYAGLASARHCFQHPEEFGLCAPFSPSFWVSEGALLESIAEGDATPIKWYVEWGTYEPSIAATGHLFQDVLSRQGAEFQANEWHEGHSWGMWRAHQDDMLEYFFPGVNASR